MANIMVFLWTDWTDYDNDAKDDTDTKGITQPLRLSMKTGQGKN